MKDQLKIGIAIDKLIKKDNDTSNLIAYNSLELIKNQQFIKEVLMKKEYSKLKKLLIYFLRLLQQYS